MRVKICGYLSILILMLVFLPSSAYAGDNKSSCRHSFSSYISDENATYFSDGTKTAICDKGCGKSETVNDNGSKLVLSKPKKLTASQTTDSITISWSRVKGATGYRVYYKTKDGWKYLVKFTGETTHTVINLEPAFKIHFAVKAYKKIGKNIVWADDSANIYTSTKCNNIKKITSTATSSAIKLSWDKVEGADGYRIYRMTADGWKAVGKNTKNTSVTVKNLTPAKDYTFAVRTYIKTDKSVFSDYLTHKVSTKTKAPETKVELESKNKIKLTFKPVDGADGYQVYRKIGSGKYELYKTYDEPASIRVSLKPDKYYTFSVRAYRKVGKKTVYGEYNPVKIHCGDVADRIVVDPSEGEWYLVLVNKTRELPTNFSVKLGYIPDDYMMDSRAAVYYNKMYEAAAKEGIYLTPVSAYRSNKLQKEIFEETLEDYIYGYGLTRSEAEKRTETEVMYPGTSEHNLGLAVDIGCCEGYFEDSDEYQWLLKNAHKYGFIERYKKDKQKITGIIPEPWHWRFVGTQYAAKIKKSGLCLEEYLEKYKLIP